MARMVPRPSNGAVTGPSLDSRASRIGAPPCASSSSPRSSAWTAGVVLAGATGDAGTQAIADKFNAATKYVATHRPESLEWKNSKALEGDVADAIRALKREDGETLLTQGSGELVRQLLAAGLVDELQLMVFPVLLGPGKRLFGEDAQASAFRLVESKTTPSGVVIARYERSGEVRTGSFADE